MKILIDIDEDVYRRSLVYKDGQLAGNSANDLAELTIAVANGTPLPVGAEILTKEAYSDLCTRAADVPDTNVGELIKNVLETLRDMDNAIDVICELDVDAVLDQMEVDG